MSETDDRTGGARVGAGRRWGAAAGLVGAGLVAGAILAGTVSANAETSSSAAPSASATETPGYGGGQGRPDRDESKSQRPDESLLPGDTAAKVRAAALAMYPGATIQRVETDSDGVYEAHLTTADGERVTVEVGKDFAVTGGESGRR
jgi:hypothetical protein